MLLLSFFGQSQRPDIYAYRMNALCELHGNGRLCSLLAVPMVTPLSHLKSFLLLTCRQGAKAAAKEKQAKLAQDRVDRDTYEAQERINREKESQVRPSLQSVKHPYL